jgi:hypothetical protein
MPPGLLPPCQAAVPPAGLVAEPQHHQRPVAALWLADGLAAGLPRVDLGRVPSLLGTAQS